MDTLTLDSMMNEALLAEIGDGLDSVAGRLAAAARRVGRLGADPATTRIPRGDPGGASAGGGAGSTLPSGPPSGDSLTAYGASVARTDARPGPARTWRAPLSPALGRRGWNGPLRSCGSPRTRTAWLAPRSPRAREQDGASWADVGRRARREPPDGSRAVPQRSGRRRVAGDVPGRGRRPRYSSSSMVATAAATISVDGRRLRRRRRRELACWCDQSSSPLGVGVEAAVAVEVDGCFADGVAPRLPGDVIVGLRTDGEEHGGSVAPVGRLRATVERSSLLGPEDDLQPLGLVAVALEPVAACPPQAAEAGFPLAEPGGRAVEPAEGLADCWQRSIEWPAAGQGVARLARRTRAGRVDPAARVAGSELGRAPRRWTGGRG